ncbi:MAG TPA: 23S rRNA (adenine(2503)-C(2))-methyltransferase RlmN [Chloroflexi bacterium]|nr:23S rRNA (adenine(2503)-C(2))-methyltransferase RlmN [Chloroflexota bacterium]
MTYATDRMVGNCCNFEQMTDLPRALREWLAGEMALYVPPVLASQEAPGGETRKDLLEMADGAQVEVVLLRYGTRRSVCVSTQVGCACGCLFCATGQMGFVRDLSAGEIVLQVVHVQRALAAQGERLSNVVLMGMGEPLLNADATLAAVRRMVDPRGLGLPARRITLSTVGIVPGIARLAEEDVGIGLAVSLHAATDAVRERLVPINRRYPLDTLFAALREYTERTQRRVMVEWLVLDGVNDGPEQARVLVDRLNGLPVHVNLIRLNPTGGYEGIPASSEAMEAFARVLDRAGIPHTMRQRRGGAIQAGCGQLWVERCSG